MLIKEKYLLVLELFLWIFLKKSLKSKSTDTVFIVRELTMYLQICFILAFRMTDSNLEILSKIFLMTL